MECLNTHRMILQYLNNNQISYSQVEHSPAKTCEESALARNEPIQIGGKTLLFKSKKAFHLFVLSAALEVDSNRVRKILKSQRLRFASPDELLELAGVKKGALPPFGKGVLPFELYVDLSILRNDKIAFNSGRLDHSIIMNNNDYIELISQYAKYANFSKP